MPNIGPLEIAVVLIIVLIIFGPKRLPELGQSMGRGIREFRNSVSGDKNKDAGEEKRELQASQPTVTETTTSQPATGETVAKPAATGEAAKPAGDETAPNPAEPVEGEIVTENKG